jgi:hypothetical protein
LSPLQNIPIANVLEAILMQGYNAISLRMLDFRAVDNLFDVGDPFQYFNYYEFSDIPSYQLQNKGWYQSDTCKVDLSCMGGHDAKFSNRKIYPLRFPRLHYSIRSLTQQNNKISDRLERSKKEKEQYGWHTHIEKLKSQKVIYSVDELFLFEWSGLYETHAERFVHND